MSEAKPHAPTAARRARARREGDVPRSAEFGALAAFAAALLATALVTPRLAAAAALALRARGVDGEAWAAIAALAFAPAAAAALAGAAVALAQGGGLRLRAVTLDPSRLDPRAGLRRMVGGEALAGAAKASLGLVAATGLVLGGAVALAGGAAAHAGAAAVAGLAWNAAGRACLGVLAVGAVLAVADGALARRRWARTLRMTHDELRRESREQEGDPHVRGQRRRLHRALVAGALERVREASFLVVNPTHVAVALRYAPPEVPVPEILVRAADGAALRARRLAEAHGVPVVEEIALARALYALGEAGRAIPAETFVAVAQVVASLLRAGALTAEGEA